jgi:hypothetical protein
VGAQDELGKLRAQLALCERLLVRLIEGEMRQAIEEYASELQQTAVRLGQITGAGDRASLTVMAGRVPAMTEKAASKSQPTCGLL